MIDRKGIRGRKPNPRREVYMQRFGMRYKHPAIRLHTTLLDMLDGCKDDEARRILLGKTEKFSADEQARQDQRLSGEGGARCT